MTVSRTPAAFSAVMASREVGFTTSEMRMCPAYCLSRAMWMTVPALWQGMGVTPNCSMSLVVARRHLTAVYLGDDAPAADFLDVGHPATQRSTVEALSARAAYSSRVSFSSSLWWMPLTSKTPWVRVPVLSKTTILALDRASR